MYFDNWHRSFLAEKHSVHISMAHDIPCASVVALYTCFLHISSTNSRTSHHWKLNVDEGKVRYICMFCWLLRFYRYSRQLLIAKQTQTQKIFWHLCWQRRLMDSGKWNRRRHIAKGKLLMKITWTMKGIDFNWHSPSRTNKIKWKLWVRNYANFVFRSTNKHTVRSTISHMVAAKLTEPTKETSQKRPLNLHNSTSPGRKKKTHSLECGEPTSHTHYDHLRGLIERKAHPHIPGFCNLIDKSQH